MENKTKGRVFSKLFGKKARSASDTDQPSTSCAQPVSNLEQELSPRANRGLKPKRSIRFGENDMSEDDTANVRNRKGTAYPHLSPKQSIRFGEDEMFEEDMTTVRTRRGTAYPNDAANARSRKGINPRISIAQSGEEIDLEYLEYLAANTTRKSQYDETLSSDPFSRSGQRKSGAHTETSIAPSTHSRPSMSTSVRASDEQQSPSCTTLTHKSQEKHKEKCTTCISFYAGNGPHDLQTNQKKIKEMMNASHLTIEQQQLAPIKDKIREGQDKTGVSKCTYRNQAMLAGLTQGGNGVPPRMCHRCFKFDGQCKCPPLPMVYPPLFPMVESPACFAAGHGCQHCAQCLTRQGGCRKDLAPLYPGLSQQHGACCVSHGLHGCPKCGKHEDPVCREEGCAALDHCSESEDDPSSQPVVFPRRQSRKQTEMAVVEDDPCNIIDNEKPPDWSKYSQNQ